MLLRPRGRSVGSGSRQRKPVPILHQPTYDAPGLQLLSRFQREKHQFEEYTVESIETVGASQPKTPIRGLCQRYDGTWRAVFRPPCCMHELRNGPIVRKRGRTRTCKPKERQNSSARMREPPLRNRSLRKADRTLPSSTSVKSPVNPQIWWRLLLLYPSFSGAAARQFQPEQPWAAAQAEVATLSTISLDLRCLELPLFGAYWN